MPLARPCLGEAELRAIERVLASGRLVLGPEVERFEEAVARRCGRAHAVAVSSGTTALEIALQAIGVGPGDEVLVAAFTWPSPAHAVRRVGARPVLVDVDPHEWNATPEAFAAARSPRTVAAIAIDQFGFPARLDALEAALPGVALVEDAACALGASLHGRACGGWGLVACLSFHPRKVLTTAEGGMCLTDDAALAARMRELRNHGQRAPGRFVQPAGNARMSELHAAVGLAQLERLDERLAERARLYTRYRDALGDRLQWQRPAPGARPVYQTAGVLLGEELADRRDALVEVAAQRGIELGRLSYALGRLRSLESFVSAPLPVSEQLERAGLALPLWPGLDEASQDRVIEFLVDWTSKS
ncbi:MAG: DegT/DnrJ/EryC1/StrS family aminotransferase [Myxococcota bacterium]|nr:DegT/DnrJ/EryC1/StrS family aminotransferase [Myxococcota bacterium]MDW8363755.1 DegT/DnrJ/EryC1/StrS family aminotransferase [Myxococcales bacterium]